MSLWCQFSRFQNVTHTVISVQPTLPLKEFFFAVDELPVVHDVVSVSPEGSTIKLVHASYATRLHAVAVMQLRHIAHFATTSQLKDGLHMVVSQ